MAGVDKSSQEKLAEGGSLRWYFSRKEIEENSPSRRDGIDLEKETHFRESYCSFLKDLGMRLEVPPETIATATVYCHRFFLRESHSKHDRMIIATACMFLAGKVEETPRRLKKVIRISSEIIHKNDAEAVKMIKKDDKAYEERRNTILRGERTVQETLGFDLNVLHPYRYLLQIMKKFSLGDNNALFVVARNFVNDGLHTSLCLQFKPHQIAAGAIFLAAKFHHMELPSPGEEIWWQELDVTQGQLEEMSNQLLDMYKRRINPPPLQASQVEGIPGLHQMLLMMMTVMVMMRADRKN